MQHVKVLADCLHFLPTCKVCYLSVCLINCSVFDLSNLSAIPHIEGFGTTVPISEQEFSMDDDIWDFLGYVEYDDE